MSTTTSTPVTSPSITWDHSTYDNSTADTTPVISPQPTLKEITSSDLLARVQKAKSNNERHSVMSRMLPISSRRSENSSKQSLKMSLMKISTDVEINPKLKESIEEGKSQLEEKLQETTDLQKKYANTEFSGLLDKILGFYGNAINEVEKLKTNLSSHVGFGSDKTVESVLQNARGQRGQDVELDEALTNYEKVKDSTKFQYFVKHFRVQRSAERKKNVENALNDLCEKLRKFTRLQSEKMAESGLNAELKTLQNAIEDACVNFLYSLPAEGGGNIGEIISDPDYDFAEHGVDAERIISSSQYEFIKTINPKAAQKFAVKLINLEKEDYSHLKIDDNLMDHKKWLNNPERQKIWRDDLLDA